VIRNNLISENAASGDGGGLAFCNGAIENNTICGNSAEGDGGGLASCNGRIENNGIRGNSAGDDGGGLHDCDGTIQNNDIRANASTATQWPPHGGGLSRCDGTIQNCTITGNSAAYRGVGLFECGGVIRNCIIWGNTPEFGGAEISSCVAPSFSCIEWSGTGNISQDPQFVDEENGDYRLKETSPCRDAGANHYWFAWPQRDLDGNCRLYGPRVDMGCYEWGAGPDADGDLLSDADEDRTGTDPNCDDTDGDGLRDGLEVLRGTSPRDPTPPRTVHVPSDIPTIQQLLSIAVPGDEIVVAPGTYDEDLQFCGVDVILRSSDPSDPGVVASTILDGGVTGSAVRFAGTESEACALSGFTIRNGMTEFGGGICGGTERNRTRATIRNNTITDNRAWYGGGGLCYCDGTIENNTITRNHGYWGGGLCYCGGAIRNNIITRNEGGDSGGGLLWCDGTIENNTISGNRVYQGGGLHQCHGTIRNNMIGHNSVYANGGGLYDCDGTIEGNTIVGNSANEGGALYDCDAVVLNCIVWGNESYLNSQRLGCSRTPTYSCIQDWTRGGQGNIALEPRFADADGPDDYPRTWEDNDYRLAADSPCIDAGMNEDWMWGTVDLDGNPRVFFGKSSKTVDMGAYEYGSWPFRVIGVVPSSGGGGELIWNSRAGDTYIVWSCLDLLMGEWREEATLSSHGEITTWTDPEVTPRLKFYRIEAR
jgi:hypothetical protein